jgi:hypothetical protein
MRNLHDQSLASQATTSWRKLPHRRLVAEHPLESDTVEKAFPADLALEVRA